MPHSRFLFSCLVMMLRVWWVSGVGLVFSSFVGLQHKPQAHPAAKCKVQGGAMYRRATVGGCNLRSEIAMAIV